MGNRYSYKSNSPNNLTNDIRTPSYTVSAPVTPQLPNHDHVSTPVGSVKSILKTQPTSKSSISSDSSNASISSGQSVKFYEDYISQNRQNQDGLGQTIKKSARINRELSNGRPVSPSIHQLFSSTETLKADKNATINSNVIKPHRITHVKNTAPTKPFSEPLKSECSLFPSYIETVRSTPNKFTRNNIQKPYSTLNSKPTSTVNYIVYNDNKSINNNIDDIHKNNVKIAPKKLKKWNDAPDTYTGSMFNLSNIKYDNQYIDSFNF